MTGTRRIALIATGGTIDSLGTDRLDLAFYTETGRRLAGGDLLRSLPEVATIAEVEEVPYPRTPSYALTPDDWMALGALVQRTVDQGFDGVVITHGTNTLEETAFFLHLMVRSDKPVVLTGAMRPANGLGSDGAFNLLRAISVAAAPSSAGLGCVVVMDGTIHAARHVTKTATFRLEPEGPATKVTWTMVGPKTIASRMMSIVGGMDTLIGKDFEKGLARLKDTAEADPPGPPGSASPS